MKQKNGELGVFRFALAEDLGSKGKGVVTVGFIIFGERIP